MCVRSRPRRTGKYSPFKNAFRFISIRPSVPRIFSFKVECVISTVRHYVSPSRSRVLDSPSLFLSLSFFLFLLLVARPTASAASVRWSTTSTESSSFLLLLEGRRYVFSRKESGSSRARRFQEFDRAIEESPCISAPPCFALLHLRDKIGIRFSSISPSRVFFFYFFLLSSSRFYFAPKFGKF